MFYNAAGEKVETIKLDKFQPDEIRTMLKERNIRLKSE
jgi:hypothetical protein